MNRHDGLCGASLLALTSTTTSDVHLFGRLKD